MFAVITFFVAIAIEVIGTYISVIGLTTLFGANWVIMAVAVALDAGKIVVVSLLYKYWEYLNKLMKGYALSAAIITMIITSAGAASYLSGEFQKAIIGTQEGSLKVEVLKTEQAKLEERKKQIDAGIAAIPDRYSANQKIRLINQFKDEQKTVTARLQEIDKQLPETQIHQIGVEAKAGPILYIAKAFNISVEEAVKWVILMIIIVFDPLAVFLIIAGNFLLEQRRLKKEIAVDSSTPPTDDPAPPTGPLPPPSDQDIEQVAVKNIPSIEPEAQTKQLIWPEIEWPTTPLPAAQISEPKPSANENNAHIDSTERDEEMVWPSRPSGYLSWPDTAPNASENKMTPQEALQFIAEEDQRLGLYVAPVPPTAEELVSPPADDQTSEQPREQITLSSLGFVKEDPNTMTGDHDHPSPRGAAISSGVYRT